MQIFFFWFQFHNDVDGSSQSLLFLCRFLTLFLILLFFWINHQHTKRVTKNFFLLSLGDGHTWSLRRPTTTKTKLCIYTFCFLIFLWFKIKHKLMILLLLLVWLYKSPLKISRHFKCTKLTFLSSIELDWLTQVCVTIIYCPCNDLLWIEIQFILCQVDQQHTRQFGNYIS